MQEISETLNIGGEVVNIEITETASRARSEPGARARRSE